MPGIFRQPPFPTQPDPSAASIVAPGVPTIPWVPDPQLAWWAAFRQPFFPPPTPDSATAAVIGPPKNIQPSGTPSAYASGSATIVEGWPFSPPDRDPQLLWWATWRRPTDPWWLDPSANAFGTRIQPSGTPSAYASGSATIKGGPQRIFPAGTPSSYASGTPKIVGGAAPGVSLYIGGVLFPMLVEGAADPIPGAGAATPPQVTSQTIGRWTCQFDVYSDTNSFVPIIGQTVQVFDLGNRIFMGCVNEVLAELLTSTARIIYHVTALDKSAILDHRVINKVYLSGSDVAAAVRDIILTWCAGEGITLNTLPLTLTTLDQDEQFYFVSARAALDKLATDCACVWWVDQQGDLHFVPVVSLPACPYLIDFTTLSPQPASIRAVSLRTTLLDYRNKQYAVSNLQALPGKTGAASLAITETYTLPQASAAAAGFLYDALILNFPIGQITNLTVNGVSQPTYLGTSGWNFRHVWWYFPGSPYLTGPNVQNDVPAFPAPPVTSPDPSNGDVIAITYVPWAPAGSPIGSVAAAGIAVAGPLTAPQGTCGSGIYEAVEQVKNVNLLSDLNAIAADVLRRSGGVPKYLQFETDLFGAQVGQNISVNIPLLGATPADSFMITSVQGHSKATNLGHGGSFTYVITAMTGQDLGNQIKWFERLVARTENALPILQYEEAIFVLAPGSSIAAGTNLTNPYIVGRSGRLVEVLISASGNPVGQNLIIDIQDNGVSIFGAVKPTLTPAGGLVDFTTFVNGAASFVFAQDVLTISSSYGVITPGSTAQAGSVTVKLRWAI
jgi:hypothetical protein